MTHRFTLLLILGLALLLAAPALAQTNDPILLQYAEPVDGSLDAGALHDYSFNGKAGERPEIVMNAKGGETDPVLRLYDPEGRLIAEDDNGNGKRNARIDGIVLAADGVYTVEAINNGPGAGRYALIINEASQVVLYHGGSEGSGGASPQSGYEAYELSRPWPHTDITYTVLNSLEGFEPNAVIDIVRRSFQAWADNTPLNFIEVSDRNADIVVEFAPIDGPSQVLGQACPPSSPCAGSVQFDSAEYWVLEQPQYMDDISLLGVATHEFGHAIGLLHSEDTAALMYPQYSPYNLAPSADDIRGVQRLYGAGQGAVVNPTPGPGSASDGSTVVGTITDDTFIHFWDFDVYENEIVTISMDAVSGGLDPLLILLDANDNILAYDDDGGGSFNAELRNITFPQSGTYTVAVTRYQQAQGFTTGDYELSIHYGELEPRPQPTAGATTPPGTSAGSSRVGSVSVRAASSSDLNEFALLDTVVERPFVDSKSPRAQATSGFVQTDRGYVWNVPWCARDEATLNENLRAVSVQMQIGGTSIDARSIPRIITRNGDLYCANHAVLLTDWSAGQITLRAVMRLSEPVYDGFNVYSAGDYIYDYTITAG